MNDLYTILSKEFEKLKNEKEAVFMTKYMKNHFEFLGIHSKERKEACSFDYLKNGIPLSEHVYKYIFDK